MNEIEDGERADEILHHHSGMHQHGDLRPAGSGAGRAENPVHRLGMSRLGVLRHRGARSESRDGHGLKEAAPRAHFESLTAWVTVLSAGNCSSCQTTTN